MLLAILAFGCKAPQNTDATPQSTEEAFESTVESQELPQPYTAIVDSLLTLKGDLISSEYCLHDITADNIPELWIKSGSCEANKSIYVYTISGDKAKLIFEDAGDHCNLYENNGKVINITAYGAVGTVSTYEYDGATITKSTPIEFSMLTEDGNPKVTDEQNAIEFKQLWSAPGKELEFINIE